MPNQNPVNIEAFVQNFRTLIEAELFASFFEYKVYRLPFIIQINSSEFSFINKPKVYPFMEIEEIPFENDIKIRYYSEKAMQTLPVKVTICTYPLNHSEYYFILTLLFSCICEELGRQLTLYTFTSSGDNTTIFPETAVCNIKGKMHQKIETFLRQILFLDPDVLTQISAAYYESASCKASMLFSTTPITDSECIAFENRTEICSEHIRQIRKYLELCDRNCQLYASYSDSGKWEICGLHRQHADCALLNTSYQLEFNGHMDWKLYFGSTPMIHFKNMNYSISFQPLLDTTLKKLLENFSSKSGTAVEYSRLTEKITYLIEHNKHGAILLIASPNTIHAELQRLTPLKRCTQLTQDSSDTELLINYSGVDGAILMDTFGCYAAIATILDGEAITPGNPARGSRYNSTQTYILSREQKRQLFLGFVFSEDKGMDIILPQCMKLHN